jgi:hypothetical protein
MPARLAGVDRLEPISLFRCLLINGNDLLAAAALLRLRAPHALARKFSRTEQKRAELSFAWIARWMCRAGASLQEILREVWAS